MMSLFSSFNPISSTNMSLNWLIMLMCLMMLPNYMWMMKSSMMIMYKLIPMNMYSQFKTNMKFINLSMNMVISVFLFIMMLNMMSLLPYTFAPTSQISINLSMAMPLWMASILMKILPMKKFFSHFIPSGTPTLLIPFMIIIEMISMFIQPITLSVRLTANITAGHILMILVSQIYSITKSTILIHCLLTTLELGVAIIQAYVFSMLINMYMK